MEIPESLRDAFRDSYRIDSVVGRGGMATVYLAADLKHERQVAIKILRPELVSLGTEAERFLREIRIAARLNHPRILPLHDSGERSGFLYYVMPYVIGKTLREHLRAEVTLPVDEAVRIAQAVAAGLDYAHRQNVLHRDIKPENILLNEGEAVVADFGIARAITVAATEHMTARGIAIGTPAYMSPEQAMGEGNLDGRSDLYGLACVTYEMLVGTPPFSTPVAATTVLRHLSEPPPPLRDRRPSVPEAVEAAVLRALAKEPDARFATAEEFAAALAAAEVTSGRASGRAAAGAPGMPLQGGVSAAERAVAVLPFVNGSPDPENEYLSDGMTDELITALAGVRGLRVTSRTSTFALKGRQAPLPVLAAELGASIVLEGTVRRIGSAVRITTQLSNGSDGRLLWAASFHRELENMFGLQEDIARTIVNTLRGGVLAEGADLTPRRYTENAKAFHLYLKGRFAWNKRTVEGIAEAVQYFEQAIAEDPNYALAYTGLSDCHALQVDYRGAPVTEAMRRAEAEARRALALDDRLAEAHTSLAWVLFIHDWDWEAAGREFARAIELNPRYPSARQWHSWFLMAMGRMDEAVAEGRMAEELDPASVAIRRSLGWLYYFARRNDEAILQLRKALILNPTSEETQWIIGLAYLAAGRYDDAEAVLREAETGARGENHHAFAALARLAVLRGHREEAEAALEKLVALGRERYVSPVDVARVHLALGNVDQVFEWIERAWQERRGWLTYLRVEPALDPIRGDRRFRELLRRMRLD